MANLRANLALVVATLTLSGVAPAQGSDVQVADFEDVPTLQTGFVLPTREGFAYAGLTWSGFYVINSDHGLTKQFPRSGYRTGKVSGSFASIGSLRSVAHSEIRPEKGGRFDVLSLYITAAWRNGLLVRLEGLHGESPMSVRDLTLQCGERQRLDLGFEDLDALRISAAGGEDAGRCEGPSCSPGPEVVFDDIVFRLRPEEKAPEKVPVEISKALEPKPVAPVTDQESKPQPPAPPKPAITEVAQKAAAKVGKAPAGTETAPQASQPVANLPHRIENQIASGVCGAKPYYGAQVGAFASKENALDIAAKLRRSDMLVQIHEKARADKDPLYFVVAGCFEEKHHAVALVKSIQGGGMDAYLTRASIRGMGPLVED